MDSSSSSSSPSPSLRPKKGRAAVQQELQLSLENLSNVTKEIQYGNPRSPTNQLFSPDSSICVGKGFVMLMNMQQAEVIPVTVESNDQEHVQSDRGNEVGKENKMRKRSKNTDKWKKNIRKMNRQSGKAYKSTANKEVPARTFKYKDCSKCLRKCSENISETEGRQMFQGFWMMKDLEKQ
ncbi:uncharacterized protein LOC124612963 [Schistocerca americana]|uniref:uncharacterized protein LOC124612963 n=1 Tax=Schistocerca americana TaxID=7009 RepID=UPI001F4F9971|nr:uncharacterized protein LOC124612963 [Schistocerca americana]